MLFENDQKIQGATAGSTMSRNPYGRCGVSQSSRGYHHPYARYDSLRGFAFCHTAHPSPRHAPTGPVDGNDGYAGQKIGRPSASGSDPRRPYDSFDHEDDEMWEGGGGEAPGVQNVLVVVNRKQVRHRTGTDGTSALSTCRTARLCTTACLADHHALPPPHLARGRHATRLNYTSLCHEQPVVEARIVASFVASAQHTSLVDELLSSDVEVLPQKRYTTVGANGGERRGFVGVRARARWG